MTHFKLRHSVSLAIFAGVLTTLPCPGQDYVFSVPDGFAPVGEEVTVPIFLDNSVGEVLGWAFGLCYDTATLTVESIDVGQDTDDAMGGDIPYFFSEIFESNGFAVSVILDSLPFTTLPAEVNEIIVANFTHELDPGESTTLTPCQTVGGHPIAMVVLAPSSANLAAVGVSGTLQGGAVPFIRGDVNDDGAVNLADSIALLGELFGGDLPGPCPAAKDINSDGSINLADPVRLLGVLFSGSPLPDAPYPDCGTVSGQTLADCPNSQQCVGG